MNKRIVVSAGIVSAAALFLISCFFLYWGVLSIFFNPGPEGVGFAIGVIPFAVMGLIVVALIVRRLAAFLRRHRLSAQAP
jgi:membrane protein implicated in regulation of membrane protease activity